jgi:hypothetical protein
MRIKQGAKTPCIRGIVLAIALPPPYFPQHGSNRLELDGRFAG